MQLNNCLTTVCFFGVFNEKYQNFCLSSKIRTLLLSFINEFKELSLQTTSSSSFSFCVTYLNFKINKLSHGYFTISLSKFKTLTVNVINL